MKRTHVFAVAALLAMGVSPVFAGGGAEADGSRPVEIEFYQQKVEAVETFDELIEQFEAANPDIDVVQTHVPDTRNVLLMRMASNDIPDVLSTYPNAPEFREFVKEGFLYDLSGRAFLDNVNPAVLEPIKIEGRDYAVPISLNTIGVLYNTRIFDDLGLSVPATWEEFLEVSEVIQAAGIRPLAFSDRDSWTIGIFTNLSVGKEMGKAAADRFFDGLAAGTVSAADNATMRLVAEMVVELRERFGTADAAALGYNDAVNAFATEGAAMYINGIWAIPSVEQANPDLSFAMFPIPATEGRETTTIYGIDVAMSVAADTEYPEESLRFVEFISSPEAAQYFSDRDNSPSVIRGVEVRSERIAPLVQLLQTGDAFEWNHFRWADGMESRFNDLTQELAINGDVDAFLNRLDQIFID
ncbi:MAG: extracellular solute-binding protein [Spirochaetales bacterium]|nr:extracellular solute-binding protein [Spirochaetales bacterium]